jgi:hypothetical protein
LGTGGPRFLPTFSLQVPAFQMSFDVGYPMAKIEIEKDLERAWYP